MTLLRPEVWLNRSPQLCRTCSPRPTKLWLTAGLQRQLFTWKGRLSRRSAGLTIPPWMTAVWVSLAPIFSDFLDCLSFAHIPSTAPVAKLQTTLCSCRSTLYSSFQNALSQHCFFLSNLDIVLHVYNRAAGWLLLRRIGSHTV